jgi:hypothetical protein
VADYRVTVRPLVTQIRIVAGAPVVSGDGGGGSGDVVGPSSATNNAIARYDGTTGKLIQSSDATIDDGGGVFCDTLTTTNEAFVGSDLEVSGNITVTGTVAGVDLPTLAGGVIDHIADTDNPHATDWTKLGAITTAELSALVVGGVTSTALASTTPAAVGTTGAVGTGTTAARADHVHALSSATVDSAGGQIRSTLTAKGDLYAATASGVVGRRAVGTDGQVLTASSADATGLAWATPTALSSTTPAEVGTTGAVGVGTTAARADHVHALSSATVDSAGGQIRSALTAKGDLYAATASGVVGRRSVGADGQVLVASSADATGLAWATPAGGGDVVGPASATDRAIAVYSTTTGKLIAGTGVIVDASDNITGITSLVLDGLTSMPTPPASGVMVYGRMRAGRTWLDAVGPSGRDYPVQPALAFNGGGFWRPSSGATINALGLPITNTGTVAHGTLTTGSLRASTLRWRMATAAAAASGLGNRANAHCCWRGNVAGQGGFTLIFRFSLQAVSANSAFFGGLLAATGALAGTAVPSAQVSCIGIGYSIGQTTLRILHNDASGACTTIDLGASFPTNVPDAFYTVVFHCAANASSVFYRVVREDTGASADGELTTDLPAATAFLAPQLHMNNNNLAETIAYECFGLALDKDY